MQNALFFERIDHDVLVQAMERKMTEHKKVLEAIRNHTREKKEKGASAKGKAKAKKAKTSA